MAIPRNLILLYVLSLFFVGLCYLAILPAFEGFDETAHYSSIRQIADTGTIPLYGASFLDQEVTDYQGPSPYSSGDPPFDQGLTYAKFFSSSLSDRYTFFYGNAARPSFYRPSQEPNWQAQHPPLYYLLLAPVERMLESVSLVTRIFILRLVSFVLALAGVVLGMLAVIQSANPARAKDGMIGFLLYPVALPMFFPEFTRIGNDSLCLLLVGTAALLLSLWMKAENREKLSLALGIVLGLGLITKAFFLPISGALGGFLLLKTCQENKSVMVRQKKWKNLILIFLPATLMGGGWYVYKFIVFSSLIGGNDMIRLANQGGLITNLQQHFSIFALGHSLIATFVSYSWAGTWSLTHLPIIMYLPLLALIIWMFTSYALELRRRPLTDSAWLPLWLFGAFGLGLGYHALVGIALSGNGQTPGWYLHILMPWVAPALGLGIHPLLQNPRTRPAILGLLAYAVLFQMAALWAQITLFTGCSVKGEDKVYSFPGHLFCLDQSAFLLSRLFLLGWPDMLGIGIAGGSICCLLLAKLWKAHSSSKIATV